MAAWDALLLRYGQYARAGGRRPGTIRNYGDTVHAFAHWSHTVPADVTPEQLRTYLANPRWAPETRRSKRNGLCAVFAYAYRDRLLPADPAADLERVHVPSGVPRPVPEDVLGRALRRAGDNPRLALMLLLGSMQGLRRAEIATLRAENITDQGLRVTGKGGKTRLVPIHPALDGALRAWKGRTGYLFPSPVREGEPLGVKYVGKLISRLLGPGWSAHTLRHRFATQAYTGTKDIRAVQTLLGHSSPATTARYTAVAAENLTDAVRIVPEPASLELSAQPQQDTASRG